MQDAHFLAVKPLSVKTTRASSADAVILNVMRHNARELQAEIGIGAESGIDPSRIHLNVTMHGPATADGVAIAARDAMRERGIVAPRKNATLGIEIVVSLPAGLPIDQLAYFRDAMDWSQQRYRVPLLSAILHNDESHPHLHLVLLPVRDGKLVGSELLGNRATMKAMQKDFHDQVARRYGLRMPAAKKRHSAADRAAGIALLRDTLQTNSGLTDRAIDALLVPHDKNPEPLLLALGLTMPPPLVKGSFVATMTRKVRPESPNRSFTKSPIGDFCADTAAGLKAENEMSYALLGDCISSPNPAHAQLLQPATTGGADQRQHSAENLAQSQVAQVEQREGGTENTHQTVEGRQISLHTATPVAGQVAQADTLLRAQAAPLPLAPGQAAPTSASAAPAKRTATHRQPATTAPTPGGSVQAADKDASSSGDIAHGGAIPAPPAGGPGRRRSPSKTGDTPAGAGDALQILQGDHHAAGDFHRQRDDDHRAECWDSERGEFITAPRTPTRPPYNARASPADIALASIFQLQA